MSARRKLNVYVQGGLVLAAIVGVLSESWLAFGLTFIVLLGCAVGDGAIRLRGRTRWCSAPRGIAQRAPATSRGQRAGPWCLVRRDAPVPRTGFARTIVVKRFPVTDPGKLAAQAPPGPAAMASGADRSL